MELLVDRFGQRHHKYSACLLKEYDYWFLEANLKQHTLGCYVIICKREAAGLVNITEAELAELKRVMLEIEMALSQVFKPNKFDYIQLSEVDGHLQLQGIPRYKEPRVFNHVSWYDQAWGSEPAWHQAEIASQLLVMIKEVITPFLPK
jgi:diadenosine tetraphosphate (Ap4A) HIT family hydrolase